MIADAPRILFLQYEPPLGTSAIATATLASLKARRPKARITVAASGFPANVLRSSPLVDELILTPHGLWDFPAALGFFLKHIRPRHKEFDYVVTDGGNSRAKIALLALASGVRRRVGITLRPGLFHTGLAFDPELSNIANNLRVLGAMDIDGEVKGPAVHFSQADLAKAQTLLQEGPASGGPLITVVARTSNSHPNEWFDERWIELCRRLIAKLDARLIFVGTDTDRQDIDRIRAALPGSSLSVAGRTDIPELAAIMALSDLTVAIDTGGLHVARAVNSPTVVLAHAATPKHLWLPLNDPLYRVLLHDYVPCAYCHRFTCATRECMQESTVDLVEAAIGEHLAAWPPSAAARAQRVAARLANPASALEPR